MSEYDTLTLKDMGLPYPSCSICRGYFDRLNELYPYMDAEERMILSMWDEHARNSDVHCQENHLTYEGYEFVEGLLVGRL